MAHVQEHSEPKLDEPMLVEGLPGVGLVGKLAADHLVRSLDMEHFASCYCEGVPRVAVYSEDESNIRAPIRLYADEASDLLVLQSDIPVSPQAAPEFATCLTGWFARNDVTPICLSGLAREKEGVPAMYGAGTGRGEAMLADHDIDVPSESGMVSGPTGALLVEAAEQGLDSVGLIVEANKQFPDPEAARVLLEKGIEPLTGVDVETDKLVEQAEEIAEAREQLAQQMQQADEESTQAQPLGMYQ
jgi:uncharacterized protein